MAPAQKPLALIAEDDRVLADVIRLAFIRAGFAVTVVTNGLKALQCAMAQEYDVICSDYQMPHLTGEQLLTQIRESGPSRQAVLLLCSAKAYELRPSNLLIACNCKASSTSRLVWLRFPPQLERA